MGRFVEIENRPISKMLYGQVGDDIVVCGHPILKKNVEVHCGRTGCILFSKKVARLVETNFRDVDQIIFRFHFSKIYHGGKIKKNVEVHCGRTDCILFSKKVARLLETNFDKSNAFIEHNTNTTNSCTQHFLHKPCTFRVTGVTRPGRGKTKRKIGWPERKKENCQGLGNKKSYCAGMLV